MNYMKDQYQTKPLHFAWVLLISFVVFNFGFVVDQTFQWSNHFRGLMNGVFLIIIFGIAWVIYLVPWSLLIFCLYRWQKWKRLRTVWLLVPSVLFSAVVIAGVLISPPSPHERFQRFTKVQLPDNAEKIHYWFSGGGLADYGDTYYFQTTPEEVDRLITEMNLVERGGIEEGVFTPFYYSDEWPDYRTWSHATLYGAHTDTGWFYYLLVNENRDEVYVSVGCI
jgi:hypothetical protein